MASAKRSPLVWELRPQRGDGFRFWVYSKQSRPQLECRPQSEPDVGSHRKNWVLGETRGGGGRGPSAGALPSTRSPRGGGGFKKEFRWGQMKTRDIKSATNMTAWREDANRREKDIRLLLSDPAGRSTPSTAAMSTKFHSSATNRELKRPSICNVSSHRKKKKHKQKEKRKNNKTSANLQAAI